MVSLPSITPEQYEVVFRRPRLMRMKCVLPPNKEPVAFFGRVIWHEIHRQGEDAICRAAVVFEPLDFHTREQLEQFLLEWA
jgi:hypothetical protein